MLFEELLDEDKEKNDHKALALTFLFYCLFLFPIINIFFYEPIKAALFNPYEWSAVLLHEFGHFFFFVSGSSQYVHVLGGTLMEYLIPSIIVLYCAMKKRYGAVALIFLACMGSQTYYTSAYMVTASHPSGYSYLSHQPVTTANHDWHYILTNWQLLGKEDILAKSIRTLGDALMLTGIVGATMGFALLILRRPKSAFELAVFGATVSFLFFLLNSQPTQAAYALFILFASLIMVILNKFVFLRLGERIYGKFEDKKSGSDKQDS
jgi:hypothetical protein